MNCLREYGECHRIVCLIFLTFVNTVSQSSAMCAIADVISSSKQEYRNLEMILYPYQNINTRYATSKSTRAPFIGSPTHRIAVFLITSHHFTHRLLRQSARSALASSLAFNKARIIARRSRRTRLSACSVCMWREAVVSIEMLLA